MNCGWKIMRSKNVGMNAYQQEAALKKLKIKQHVDLCRRRVIYYEWKLSMLQMTMEDLKIFLKRIEKCNVCFPCNYYNIRCT